MNKKHYLKSLVITFALILMGWNAQAQYPEYSLFLNGVLPTGDLGTKVDVSSIPLNRSNICKGANAGLGVTFRAGMRLDLGFGDMTPYVEGGFLWNASTSDLRDGYEASTSVDGVRGSAPEYLNIPILIGAKYRYELTDVFKPFAEFGLGCNLLFISGSGYKDNEWYSFQPTGAFAWSIGAGSYFTDMVSLTIYYVGLGDHNMEFTSRSYVQDDGNALEKRHIGEFGIRLGFHLTPIR